MVCLLAFFLSYQKFYSNPAGFNAGLPIGGTLYGFGVDYQNQNVINPCLNPAPIGSGSNSAQRPPASQNYQPPVYNPYQPPVPQQYLVDVGQRGPVQYKRPVQVYYPYRQPPPVYNRNPYGYGGHNPYRG